MSASKLAACSAGSGRMIGQKSRVSGHHCGGVVRLARLQDRVGGWQRRFANTRISEGIGA